MLSPELLPRNYYGTTYFAFEHYYLAEREYNKAANFISSNANPKDLNLKAELLYQGIFCYLLHNNGFNKNSSKNRDILKRVEEVAKYSPTDPRFVHLNVIEAQVTGNKKTEEELTKEWEKALVKGTKYENNPSEIFKLYETALEQAKNQDYESAGRTYLKISKEIPNDPRAFSGVAKMLFNLGRNYPLTGKYADRAISADMAHVEGWGIKGLVSCKEMKFSTAKKFLGIAKRLNSNNSWGSAGLRIVDDIENQIYNKK